MSERPATQIRTIAEQGISALRGQRRITISLRTQLNDYFQEIARLATDLDARTGTLEAREPYT